VNGVARCLEQLGHEVIVADPNFALMYATRQRKVSLQMLDAECAVSHYNDLHEFNPHHRQGEHDALGARDLQRDAPA
jgi:hypothetical protein